jgi:hypothetical protein
MTTPLDDDFDRLMGNIRRNHARNDRLNANGIYYNVWTIRINACARCGSAFEAHHCTVVGSPTDAHRIAQPKPEQDALW